MASRDLWHLSFARLVAERAPSSVEVRSEVPLTDEVSEAEADDFLRIFSHRPCETREAAWWWQTWQAEDEAMPDIKNMEGYDEMLEKFLGKLTPEERLRGLAPEQLILALPDDALRGFSDEYLRTLPPDAQATIRARIGRPASK